MSVDIHIRVKSNAVWWIKQPLWHFSTHKVYGPFLLLLFPQLIFFLFLMPLFISYDLLLLIFFCPPLLLFRVIDHFIYNVIPYFPIEMLVKVMVAVEVWAWSLHVELFTVDAPVFKGYGLFGLILYFSVVNVSKN